jgi:hypothetical protein
MLQSADLYANSASVCAQKDTTMARFIVMGSVMEYMAHLHIEAADKDAARAAWEDAFTSTEKASMHVSITNLAERPDMVKYWRGNGDRYYSGSYNYNS